MCIMHQDLHLFLYKIQIYNFRPMQIGLRDVPWGKPTVSELKISLFSWINFFSDEGNFNLSGHMNK